MSFQNDSLQLLILHVLNIRKTSGSTKVANMKTIEFSKKTPIDFPVSDFQARKYNTSNIVHVEQGVPMHFRIYKTNAFIHWAYITINKNQGHEFEKEQVKFYGRCGGRKEKIEERNDIIALQSQQKGITDFKKLQKILFKN